MRKIVVAVMSTISGLVLLLSYHTSTNSEAATTTTTGTSGNGTDPAASASTTPNAGEASSSTTTTPSASSSSSTSTSTSSGSSSSASGTYTGDAVQTRWGTVQVQITVKDGKITAAEAVQYPNENPKDQQINAYAVPQLNAEVVSAQSASIDAVSGATVTSDGYITSLQSAIDQANLK
jgi:uncharacterized protein with FMN-binding domain